MERHGKILLQARTHARLACPPSPTRLAREAADKSTAAFACCGFFVTGCVMQPASVVVEDDIVHYSLFVDDYINLGKDANIDNLRAIMIDCLAFMYADFLVYIVLLSMRSLRF